MTYTRETLAVNLERAVEAAQSAFNDKYGLDDDNQGEDCSAFGVRFEPADGTFNIRFSRSEIALNMHCMYSMIHHDVKNIFAYGLNSNEISGIIDDVNHLTLKDTPFGLKKQEEAIHSVHHQQGDDIR